MVSNLTQVDSVLAQRVADGLGMPLPAPPKGLDQVPYTDKPEMDDALSMASSAVESVKGRKIAILAANGVNGESLQLMCKALEAVGAYVKIIAPICGNISSANRDSIKVDHSFPTVSSVMFDSVYIPGGTDSIKVLSTNSFAILFINETYKHGKPIAASDEGLLLMAKAARAGGAINDTYSEIGIAIAENDEVDDDFAQDFIALIGMHRFNERPDLDAIAA